MKNIFPLFFLICSLSCTTQKTIRNDYKGSYAVIAYQERYNIFKDASPTELNEAEISNVDRILEDALSQYDLFKRKGISLNNYKRQYIPVINKFGEKEVWVNCFCKNSGNWKTEIIIVDDGGSCYFNMKINLSNSKYYDFVINGDA